MTFHTSPSYLPASRSTVASFHRLLRTFQSLHSQEGLRLLHYSPDGCLGKAECPALRYYTNFDSVWYRPTTNDKEEANSSP